MSAVSRCSVMASTDLDYEADTFPDKFAALLDCLFAARVIRSCQYDAALHKRRFSRACRRHSPGGRQLQDVLYTSELVSFLATGLHLGDLCHLEAASRSTRGATREFVLKRANDKQLVLFDGDKHFVHFDPAANEWKALPAMPSGEGRCQASVVASSGNIYVCGGQDLHSSRGSIRILSTVLRFDLTARRACWKELPPMLTARISAAAAVLNGHIDICGGHHPDDTLDSAERYSLSNGGGWHMLPTMCNHRTFAASAVIGGRFYVCGGSDLNSDSIVQDVAECFDPGQGRWKLLPRMPNPRPGTHWMDEPRPAASIVGLGGCLYIAGGMHYETAIVDRYDPMADTWTSLPPMAAGSPEAIAMATCNDCLYVFGGVVAVISESECDEDDDGRSCSIERFSISTGQREACVSEVGQCELPVAASLGSRIYVFGRLADSSVVAQVFDPAGTETQRQLVPRPKLMHSGDNWHHACVITTRRRL